MNREEKVKELAKIIALECLRQTDLLQTSQEGINKKVDFIADLYNMYYIALNNNEKINKLFDKNLLP